MSYKKIAIIFIGLILCLLAVRYAVPIRDTDIWFHLLYAKQYITNFSLIPDHTLYSWTPTDNKSIYCTWLADLILYLFYKVAEVPGLLALRYICFALVIGLLLSFSKKLNLIYKPTTWLIIVLAMLASDTAFFCKPELFSYLYMAIIAWNWWRIKSADTVTRADIYLFPLIILIWANSHGGIIFGLVFLFLLGISEILNSFFLQRTFAGKLEKHFYFALLLCFGALFLTPYGWRYPVELYGTCLPTEHNLKIISAIAAYGSPAVQYKGMLSFIDFANIMIVILVIISLPLVRRRKIDFSFLVTNIAFAFLYTRYFRTTFYWAPVFGFSSLYLLSFKPFSGFYKYRKIHIMMSILVVALSFSLLGRAIVDRFNHQERYLYLGLGKGEASPYFAADYIAQEFPGYNIGNTYAVGAYLAWKLWPNNKIMIDARQFPYLSWFDAYRQFEKNPDANLEFMKDFSCEVWCVNLNKSALVRWFHRADDWQLGFMGTNSAVFVRKNLFSPEHRKELSKEQIATVKNTLDLYHVFMFYSMMQDWENADYVLSLFAKRGKYSPNDRLMYNKCMVIKDINYAYYHDKNFLKCLELVYKNTNLLKLKSIAVIIWKSLIFEGNKEWSANNYSKSLAFFLKAHQLFQTKYTLYNIAVVLEKSEAQHISLLDGHVLTWQDMLAKFLEINGTENDQIGMKYQLIAEEMLTNQTPDLPEKLFLPAFD